MFEGIMLANEGLTHRPRQDAKSLKRECSLLLPA